MLATGSITYQEIAQENKQYLLRCTQGIFDGKFLYINKTPDGEVFGSGDPEVNEDITMYIESADLSARHAMIRFSNTSSNGVDSDGQGSYILSDCNSETGTWVRPRQTFAEFQNSKLLQLHENLNREFSVGPH